MTVPETATCHVWIGGLVTLSGQLSALMGLAAFFSDDPSIWRWVVSSMFPIGFVTFIVGLMMWTGHIRIHIALVARDGDVK